MQIQQIKISNMMSFPYLQNIEESEGIHFDNNPEKSKMNILIGANGSGKTNFIEIIKQIITTLVLDYSYLEEHLHNEDPQEKKKTIQVCEKKTSKLHKNFKFPDQPAKVQITIDLSYNDFENIGFVCKFSDRINEIIGKYSEQKPFFPKENFKKLQERKKEIKLNIDFDEKKQSFHRDESSLSQEEIFMLSCIRHQELLNICISIFNTFEKKEDERLRYPLKNTFAILGSERTLEGTDSHTKTKKITDLISGKNKSEQPHLQGYYLCINKIWNVINNSSQEIILDSSTSEGDQNLQEKLEKSIFREKITKIIQQYFGKTPIIDYIQGGIDFKFKEENGEITYFDDLSDGQQSLLILFLTIYGYDLKDGFLIINEPELHSHPQMQKDLAKTLEHISKKNGTQFIISTYSALFINENNITQVYRFSKDQNGNTEINNPSLRVSFDDAKLVHLLRFENLSKIFFVDKIILVEGESDFYFFSWYIKQLQNKPEWDKIIKNYEIININGKGSYKGRNKFLLKFGIQNYFIGDRDNTVDYGFFTQKEINKYYQLANRHFEKNKHNKSKIFDYYNRLVQVIKQYYPQKYKKIIDGINDLYNYDVFILKLGAIESYPGLERKGLQQMVNWCNYESDAWREDKYFDEQRKELNEIFFKIFND